MDEQAKFNAWWESKGTNSVILRAQAWSAWLARAEAEQQQPEEDSDEWVILDPVKYADHVLRWNIDFTNTRTGWEPITIWAGDTISDILNDYKCTNVVFRCRRRDLPKVEQPEQSSGSPEPELDKLKRHYEHRGRRLEALTKKVRTLRRALTDYKKAQDAIERERQAEWMIRYAESLPQKPQPQPQKTRVRLWVSQSAVIVRDAHETGFGKEIHHDSEGFYVENQS